jgi:eukaryotic-like serine/threonine-protein kinase
MERFGPYRLVRRLAMGGMAEVFLARQLGIEGFEREVVIKRILPHRAQDEEFSTMFLDEARLIARLNHPYIAQVYDLGQAEGTFYIAMEYVQGVDLSHLLDQASEQGTPGLPMPVAVSVITSLCEALEYIHSRTDELGHPLKIVHRDLNPKNVILSFDGAVKLIDFGIAKAASQVYETRTGVIKGTYGYMAPEQVSRAHPIDARADLFSLGVLTYELSTGIHPFDAPDEVAVLGKLVRCQFQPPTRKIRNYPKSLERIIMSCMAQDPRSRPANARQVLTQLEDFALERKIPLTMSRIAEYVRRNHAAKGQRHTEVPPLVTADGDSTAMISQRLARRADHEAGQLATSLLRAPRAEGGRGQPEGTQPIEPSDRDPTLRPAGEARGWQWPWASWGRRERVIALIASAVAVVATVTSMLLIVAALRPPEPQPHSFSLDPLRGGGLDLVGQPDASKASPVAPQGGSSILVESVPSAAKIFVGGKISGQYTPASIRVPPGSSLIWIRVELDGYRPEQRQVDVGAGAARFELTRL